MDTATVQLVQVRLLTDVLCHAIGRGRADAALPEPRRRHVIAGLIAQHFQGGVLDLDAVWRALLREPALTERSLAGTFVATEELAPLLQVPVRQAQRLQALNATRRQALLLECPVAPGEIDHLLWPARLEMQLALIAHHTAQVRLVTESVCGCLDHLTAQMTGEGHGETALEEPYRHMAADAIISRYLRDGQVDLAAIWHGMPGPAPAAEPDLLAPGPPAPGPPPVMDLAALGGVVLAPPVMPAPQPAAEAAGSAAEDAAGEARVRAARALLSQANKEMADEARAERGRERQEAQEQPRTVESPVYGKKRAVSRVRALAISLAGLLIAASVSGYLIYADTPHEVDLSQSSALKVTTARRLDETLQATITDPRWETMDTGARKTAVTALFQELRGRGIRALFLFNRAQVMVAEVTDDPAGSRTSAEMVLLHDQTAPLTPAKLTSAK